MRYQTKRGSFCEDSAVCQSQGQGGSESESRCEFGCECWSQSEGESEIVFWIARVRVMVLVGGISDRGVWEMGYDREMLDVRVESMRGER